MKILIIDDSSVMRKVVERALRQTEVPITEILQAGNGLEALIILRNLSAQAASADGEYRPLNVIFSDVTMPQMTGLEFLAQRRTEGLLLDVPVIMITSEGLEPLVRKALELGARGYICKPFTPDQVKAQLLPLVPAA